MEEPGNLEIETKSVTGRPNGGNRFLAAFIRFMADVMTGVPSIVMGLFIFSIWVIHFGYSGLAGAFALGLMMIPIVMRTTEEMVKLVPRSLREASLALGIPWWVTTLRVTLPSAMAGVRAVSQQRIQVALALGASEWQVFRYVILPSAMPLSFTGETPPI